MAFLRRDTRALDLLCALKRPLRTQWEGSPICKPGREHTSEPDHASTLILDFQSPELREKKSLLFKPLCLWYFIMAAWEDQYVIYVIYQENLSRRNKIISHQEQL
jgi:hypothetical protein